MLCVFYVVIFGILGIFSATHRKLFFESLECVKNTFTRQPCETNIDQKVKTSIVHKIFQKNPKVARFVNKYFKQISFVLIVLTLITGLLTFNAGYDLIVHGTCTPVNPENCVATGTEVPSLD